MKTLKILSLAALLSMSLTACSDSDDPASEPTPTPPPTPVTIPEGLCFDDRQIEINSVFMYEYYSSGVAHSIIALSTEKNAPSGDDLYTRQAPGIYVVINRSEAARFDLKRAEGYSIYSTLPEETMPQIEIYPDNAAETIEKGECLFEVAEGTGKLELDLTLADGRRLTARFDAPYEEVNEENLLVIDKTSRPIQTAFLAEIDENTYGFYFTAQVIDPDPAMIGNCSQWAALVVPGEALTGQTYDLAAADSPYMMFAASDLLDRVQISYYQVEAVPEGDCTGDFSIKMLDQEGHYDVRVNCTDANGKRTTLTYQGEIPVYTEPEVKSEFLVDDEFRFEINSAVIDMRTDIYTIYLSSQRGCATVGDMLDDNDRIELTLPASYMGENGAGFSQSDDVSISYAGQTLNYQANAMGRIDKAILEGEHLSLKFYTMAPVKWMGTYEGNVHLIQ